MIDWVYVIGYGIGWLAAMYLFFSLIKWLFFKNKTEGPAMLKEKKQ